MAILEQIDESLSQLLKKRKAIKISSYLDDRSVSFLNVESRDLAIEKLVSHLHKHGRLIDKDLFHKAILEREKIVSTGIGMGVSIPHAKLPDFKEFFIAIVIQKEKAIEWNALDKAPVRLIFMIGGPEDKQNEYLQILSKLTQVIKNESLRKQIVGAKSAKDVIKLLSPF